MKIKSQVKTSPYLFKCQASVEEKEKYELQAVQIYLAKQKCSSVGTGSALFLLTLSAYGHNSV